ncbi:hypothetical protein C8J56DRAFT_854591 [Mycena floridula]|nr:hypothetical protein C8J56DRAFT_854591 [Mycena floridula]
MLGHILLSVVLAAGLVSAQSLSISPGCTDTLTSLLTSPDAACLNPGAFLSLAISSQQASIPDTINTWLNGVCSTGSCSNASLTAVVNELVTGCSSDLATFGLSSGSTDEIVSLVLQVYPTVREVACLKDDTVSQLCVTSTLNNVESVIGQVDIKDLSFLNIVTDFKNLLANGKTLACSDCLKEAFVLTQESFPSLLSDVSTEAQDVCGASFIDGSSPSGISQTAAPGVFSAAQPKDSGVARSQSLEWMILLVLSFGFMVVG